MKSIINLQRIWPLLLLLAGLIVGCSEDPVEPPDSTLDTRVVVPDSTADTGDTGNEPDGEVVTPPTPWTLTVQSVFENGRADVTFADCLYASPLLYESAARGAELIATGGDVVVGLDPNTGTVRWSVDLEDTAPLRAFAAATPALHDGLLLVGYALRKVDQDVNVLDPTATGTDAGLDRESHWVAVVDLENKQLDPRFPALELKGSVPGNEGGTVDFRPSHAFMRPQMSWFGHSAQSLGLGYASFGNVRDLQPWHGWVFEIDLDAWSSGGEAISGLFSTTPEENCGAEGASGSFQRLCGGGLWSPSGWIEVPTDNERGFDLVIGPGNGQLDLNRNDFANTLLRMPPGLDFKADCDETLCADFDVDSPARDCVESCTNVFVPRLREDEGPIDMPDGRCDGLSFFECWAQADYIGGSSPILTTAPGGERVLVYPTKDGHAYLVDADNLGTQYDRFQMVAYCGTPEDECIWSWSGMVVTQPAETTSLETPLLLFPTFMPDHTNPAGVVALRIIDTEQGPRFERAWDFPNFSDPVAIERFRRHTSRIRLATFNGAEVAILTEPGAAFQPGRGYVVDVSNGNLLAEFDLSGSGYRFTVPLLHGDTLYVNSCDSDHGTGYFETFQLSAEPVQ